MGAIIISTLLMVFFALSFIRTVQEALWNNAVRNLIETTQQGANGLERALKRDKEITGAGNRCIQIKRYGNSL